MIRRSRSVASEGGFTLIELLVAMSVSALLVGIIAATVRTGYRTTGQVSDRLEASHGTELIDNYLPRDVASSAPTGIDASAAAPTGCSGGSPGTNVVLLPYALACHGA